MASIREDEHGFQIRWRDPDGKDRARRFSKKKQPRNEALKSARTFLQTVQKAEDTAVRWEPPRSLRVPTLSEALDAFIRDYSISRSPATSKVTALTLRVFREWVLMSHRHPGVDVISRDLVNAFFEHRRSTPRTAGKHTLTGKNRTITTLRKNVQSVLHFWEWCYDHEAYGDHVPRPPRKFPLPTVVQTKPTRAPTWEEMDACVAACTGWQHDVAIVLRYTGLRVGQVMGLRWEHFDLDAGLLYFPGTLGKTRYEKQGRVIPLSAHLVAVLATWGKREEWLVKSGRKEGSPRERVFRSRDMARAWKRAGVRPEVWEQRPDHAFRKGLTTGLKRLGADPEAAEHLVGRKLAGERGTYVDAAGLPLVETVALIPPIGPAPAVLRLPRGQGVANAIGGDVKPATVATLQENGGDARESNPVPSNAGTRP